MINFLVTEYHYVYWIKLNEETDMKNGYIGVTRDIRKRINQHLCHKSGAKEKTSKVSEILADLPIDSISVDVIFTGSKEECFALEKKLRPRENIGWNVAVGGNSRYVNNNRTPIEVSQKTRDRLSKANKGRKLNRPSITKGVHKWDAENRKRIGLQHKGKVVSPESIAKQMETKKYSNKVGKYIDLKYRNNPMNCRFHDIQEATRFLQNEGIPIGISTLKSAVQRRATKLKATTDWTIEYETSHPLLGARDWVDLTNKKQKRQDYESGKSAQIAHGKYTEIVHKENPEKIIKCASTKVAAEFFGISGAGLRGFTKKYGLMAYHHSGYAVKQYGINEISK